MRITKKMKKMVKHVWENRNDGVHAFYPLYHDFITIECLTDGDRDYIEICLTDEIDSLGYVYGNVLDVMYVYETEIDKFLEG